MGIKFRHVLCVIVALLIACYINRNFYRLVLIQGESMLPTYHHLQLSILNVHDKKYSYGDVIAFFNSETESILVKRIVGLPNDVIKIENESLYVNNKISTVYCDTTVFEYAGNASQPITLSEQEYYVIGDNISKSKDSRYDLVGIVSAENIVGKLIN